MVGSSRVVLGCLVWLAAGCGPMAVHYRSSPDINFGQPVALHVHQLGGLPQGLRNLSCEDLRPATDPHPLDGDRVGEATVISALPDERSFVSIDRVKKGRWLLVAPEWEDCRDATSWALVRRRKDIHLDLADRVLRLPWDASGQGSEGPWRQRGYVDGSASHVLIPRRKATR